MRRSRGSSPISWPDCASSRPAHSPTLPFVTAATTSDDMVRKLRTALGRAIADPALADVRATLFLTGVVPADADALAPIVALETAAVGAGHAALA